jgi:type I restriction enzyme M protein
VQATADVTRRLWALCNVLRDDGITYHEYISELTLILFFRLADLLDVESAIPSRYRWNALRELDPESLLQEYREALAVLAESNNSKIHAIFQGSRTDIRNAVSLARIIEGIDTIDWQKIAHNSVGDVYESLIARNAQESRYGAGQYFTPRALVDAIVRVCKPTSKETVYDPAAGTAGFLVAAGIFSLESGIGQCALEGTELVPAVHRLAQMNIHLHRLQARFDIGDTLSRSPCELEYDVCLTNPPFGVRGDLNPMQTSYLQFPTSNKQLSFLQHIYSSLRVGGRAAVVVPDNVLFETGTASAIRTNLLDNYNVHTILRLPSGIFYATGVKTSVLFFSRTGATENTWIYDLRSANGAFTKKRPLEFEDLKDFVQEFGEDPNGSSRRRQSDVFTPYKRADIRELSDRLDLGGARQAKIYAATPAATLELISSELDQAVAAVRELQEVLARADSVD